MALNSRQRRARARKLALLALAKARNPAMVASQGHVRSSEKRIRSEGFPSARKTMRSIDTPWENGPRRGKVVGRTRAFVRVKPGQTAPKATSQEYLDARAREVRLGREKSRADGTLARAKLKHRDELDARSLATPARK